MTRAKPPWWIDPLAYRLAEVMEECERRRDPVTSFFIKLLTAHGPTKLRSSLEHLFATDRDGRFQHRALAVADTFWLTPYAIVGEPAATLEDSNVIRIGVLAELLKSPDGYGFEKLRQVNAVAHVMAAVVDAIQHPPSLRTDAPRRLDDAGVVVGVRHVGWKRAAARGLDYQQMVRLKGAAALTIGHFEAVFGRPHYIIAATLLECLTGKRLTASELRTLIEREKIPI
jgi:hypothetical protein